MNVSSSPTDCWCGRVFGLSRNRPDSRRYHPFRAQKMARKRRPRPIPAKLASDEELRHYVVECLSKRWGPQHVGRALEQGFRGEKRRQLAHETIYRALYQLSIRPVPSVFSATAFGRVQQTVAVQNQGEAAHGWTPPRWLPGATAPVPAGRLREGAAGS